MTQIPDTPYIESENIHIFISILNEIETLNKEKNYISPSFSADTNMMEFQSLLYDAIEIISNNTNLSSHQIERIFNDIIIDGDMRFNIINFCRYSIEWLITSDKTAIKKILIKNASSENYENDLKVIEKW